MVEYDRVPVGEIEGSCFGPALHAPYGARPYALDAGLRIERPAARAAPGHIGIAQVPAGHEAVVARSGCDGSDLDVPQAEGDGVADLGSGHLHGPRHLMAAPDGRSDHRAPAARRGVGHDVPPVLDRPEHGPGGI